MILCMLGNSVSENRRNGDIAFCQNVGSIARFVALFFYTSVNIDINIALLFSV